MPATSAGMTQRSLVQVDRKIHWRTNMRTKLIIATLLGVFAGAASVWTVLAAPDLHLRGGRFHPLTYAELDPAQKAMADAALASGRSSFDGPLNINLRSP